ncbi:hypothetical protein [Microbacterium sp. ZOR0019]|uniref:hypothetical protein n=1 Tax=Microbacterium sp. ZOR0019 TaxID=1339233 RepID=UPI00064846D1|nr:hypothetical protein [Microbacterium sp. ZOR0019]
MKDWSGVGDAYSASYAALCAGTFSAMREVLGEGNGRSLVDVGAGDGTLAARWAADGWTVTAGEPEPTSGAVVATVWTRSPSWLWAEITERSGIAPFVGARLSDAEDFERTADGFGRMLQEAGLPHVAVTEIDWIWNADPDSLWLSVDGGVAGAGALHAGLDQAERQRFRTAFDTVVEERSVRGSLLLEHRAAIAVSAGR